MGFIQEWIDRKRRHELERINREIEELKRKGPDFAMRETGLRTVQSTPLVGKRQFPVSLVVIVLVVLLIGVFFYYQTKISSLEEDYTTQEQEMITLQDRLHQALLKLNTTESELEIKEVVESNLSKQYSELKSQVTLLQLSLDELNETLTLKVDEVGDLQQELLDKEQYISALEACIKNNTIDDKEDCL